MSTPSPTLSAVRSVPLAALSAFPDLFETYCTDFDAVRDFYAGDFRDPAARQEAADRAAAHPRDRDTLADVLLEHHEAWGCLTEEAKSNIEALRAEDTVAVVTGQQVGLFGGPLYTVYKTITALKLADQLAEETGRTVVPVFWVEGEDHDFAEIDHTWLLHRNEPVQVQYAGHAPPEDGNIGAVGRLRLTEQIEDVLDEVDDILPPSDFKPAVMEALRTAYAPGTRIEDAFVQFVHALFPDSGLVYLNPDDARLKRLVQPLFRQEIEEHDEPHRRVEEASEPLRERFHAQVRTRPTNLFLLDDTGRHPIDAEDGGTFRLRGTDRTFTQAELLQRLDDAPEQFSPNVVLRPLTQDALVPTAAYVAGPGEVSYFAQYKGVYEWAGIPMPLIYPRASVSLVESKVQKVLDKFELPVDAFSGDAEQLFQRVVMGLTDVDIDEVFADATRHVHEAINTIKPAVEEIDRTLIGSAEAARAALQNEMEDLKSRVIRAEKRNHDEIRAQLQKAHVNLFPQGGLQERLISAVYFLNKYSLDLIDQLRAQLSLDTTAHQVVEL